ncbi:MAG TPA: prephenate dehydratase domain-containing protein [Candidatus Limnocylindria bacterium]|nr:prephenate dehydratase domain-containing protein [Candidatus Limnocylindria bacterium]
MKVAIQGIAGSFHHEAARKMLGSEIEILACTTFQKVFEAVKDGRADKGVVAIENSLHGSINAVYRLLARNSSNNSIWVCGETTLHINQYLIAARDLPLEAVQTVLSQAPALAQCELWLEADLPQAHLEETHDTAESVRYVVAHPDESLAAIAGKHAAELHGGTILAGPVNDDKHNYTRFFLLSREKLHTLDANKTSIILETNHQSGALYNALGAFAKAGVNLSKLDSHPIANDQKHYTFYVDFEASLDERLEHQVFDTLRAQGCKITVLGSYKTGEG